MWQFLKFIQEHENNKFSNFGPLTWPPMTSSKLGPFFHGQTLINWRCSNFFKNQYFSTKFGQQIYFYVEHIINKEMTVFAKFSEFLSFSDLPENFDFGPFSSQIPDREVYLMPSNLMILLVLLYIYHLSKILRLYQFWF